MKRAGVAVLLLLAGLPAASAAQLAVRVKWTLMDFLVRGDSTGDVRVLWSPNLWTTVTGERATRLRSVRVESIDALQWAALMRRLVDSAAQQAKSEPIVMLNPGLRPGDGVGNAIQLGAARERGKPPFRLYLIDSAGSHAWEVVASRDEVRALLNALDDVARAAVFPEHRASRARRHDDIPPCPLPHVGDVINEDSMVDEPPVPVRFPDLVYPLRAYPDEGRVWVQFVIDTSGVFERGSACVLLTDSRYFLPNTLDVLPDLRFRPGRRRGVPVRTLYLLEFQFRTRT